MLPPHSPTPRTAWVRVALAANHLHHHTLGEAIGRHPRQQLTWLGLLALPLLLPLSIPGMATTVAAFCVLVAASIFLGRCLPLPHWLQQRRLPGRLSEPLAKQVARLTSRLARISQPRLLRLSDVRSRRLNGVMLALAGLAMMTPVPMVSFDNVVPALATVLLAWGLRVRDGRMLLAGYVTTVLAWGYVALLWWLGAELLLWLLALPARLGW